MVGSGMSGASGLLAASSAWFGLVPVSRARGKHVLL